MTDELDKLDGEFNDESPEAEPELVWFTVNPLKNYKYGRWQFKDGVLGLAPFEASLFREEIKSLPQIERAQIKEIDSQKGVDLVRAHQAATRGLLDTGTRGVALQQAKEATPKLGTKVIG